LHGDAYCCRSDNGGKADIIRPASKYAKAVVPDLIRHPVPAWIPASAGMTKPEMFNAGVISFVGCISAMNILLAFLCDLTLVFG
jgi:hypothetical protein